MAINPGLGLGDSAVEGLEGFPVVWFGGTGGVGGEGGCTPASLSPPAAPAGVIVVTLTRDGPSGALLRSGHTTPETQMEGCAQSRLAFLCGCWGLSVPQGLSPLVTTGACVWGSGVHSTNHCRRLCRPAHLWPGVWRAARRSACCAAGQQGTGGGKAREVTGRVCLSGTGTAFTPGAPWSCLSLCVLEARSVPCQLMGTHHSCMS